MAKKTHIKVKWFQKVIQTVNLFTMQKTYLKVKAQDKLKLKNIILTEENTNILLKKLPSQQVIIFF